MRADHPISRLWLTHHCGRDSEPAGLVELGDEAEAQKLVIRELAHWVVASWPAAKRALKVLSLAREIGEPQCRRK